MTDEKPRVIIIPPKPELQQTTTVTTQLRVAAYCRVSTKEEEQASSYEAQCEYYTDKIMSNKEWTMAGIFADEGITGTSTKKRTEFLRMIRQCKQKKIDLILTKSIQRFARNTLDCINYTRILRQLGIGVLFEKENINSLPADSEFMITMYGAMAQSESESISGNVKWGKKRAMEAGKVSIAYKNLYAYEKGADGKPAPIPAQAEIVRELYTRYLAGASLRELKDWLEHGKQPTVAGGTAWSITAVKGILTNEKYCGDVLLQKTFSTDVISKKVVKNTGQLPKYLIQNHHEGIVTREQFQAVQAELARRSALRSDSKQAATGRSCYTSKYALSDRLVCGECGKLYRRKTRNIKGNIYHEWRCISRLDYGKRYCHDSPTLREIPLQNAILAAINEAMEPEDVVIGAAGSLPGDLQRMWRARARDTYNMEYGYSTMGYEVAGAFGVKLAVGDAHEVYAMCGDGSFNMLHSELLTAVQEHKKINICLFDNASFGCINNLQVGHGNETFCTELRFRSERSGKLDGSFMPVDYAAVARAYGCRAYTVRTMQELQQALREAKTVRDVPVLFDIKVLPKSMTDGYGAWWRVGDTEQSENPANLAAYEDHLKHLKTARKY